MKIMSLTSRKNVQTYGAFKLATKFDVNGIAVEFEHLPRGREEKSTWLLLTMDEVRDLIEQLNASLKQNAKATPGSSVILKIESR